MDDKGRTLSVQITAVMSRKEIIETLSEAMNEACGDSKLLWLYANCLLRKGSQPQEAAADECLRNTHVDIRDGRLRNLIRAIDAITKGNSDG